MTEAHGKKRPHAKHVNHGKGVLEVPRKNRGTFKCGSQGREQSAKMREQADYVLRRAAADADSRERVATYMLQWRAEAELWWAGLSEQEREAA